MKKLLFLLGAVTVIAGGAYFFLHQTAHTPISKLLENPQDYIEKQTTIQGTVTETYPLVVVKYFTLQDESGTIKVKTDINKALPMVGNKIRVTGRLKEGLPIPELKLYFDEELTNIK